MKWCQHHKTSFIFPPQLPQQKLGIYPWTMPPWGLWDPDHMLRDSGIYQPVHQVIAERPQYHLQSLQKPVNWFQSLSVTAQEYLKNNDLAVPYGQESLCVQVFRREFPALQWRKKFFWNVLEWIRETAWLSLHHPSSKMAQLMAETLSAMISPIVKGENR